LIKARERKKGNRIEVERIWGGEGGSKGAREINGVKGEIEKPPPSQKAQRTPKLFVITFICHLTLRT